MIIFNTNINFINNIQLGVDFTQCLKNIIAVT